MVVAAPGTVTDMSTLASSHRPPEVVVALQKQVKALRKDLAIMKAKTMGRMGDQESVCSTSTRASKQFSEEQKSVMRYASTSLFQHVKVVSDWSELEYGGEICTFMMRYMKIGLKYRDRKDKESWWEEAKKAVPEGLGRRRSNVQGMLRKAVRGTLALCVAVCVI